MSSLFLFLLFLSPLSLLADKTLTSQKQNISSPYYDFKGSCSSIDKEHPELLCLPTGPITFDDLFSSKFQEVKIQEINEWFQKNPYFGVQKVIAKAKGSSVAIYLKEDLDAETVLYRFNEYDMITPFSVNQMLKNSTKTDELMKLPPINFEGLSDLELVFALLFHLYWNKISDYRPLMRFFPEKLETPVFSLTPYELDLLKGDETYVTALLLRKGIHESFQNFTRIIKSHWTDEQAEVFFRNYNPIKEDFMYAMMLVNKYGWEEKEYQALQKKPHLYIPLGLFLFSSKMDEFGLSYRRTIEKKKNITYIDRFILSTQDISKDNELSIKMGIKDTDVQVDPDDHYLLLNDYIPEDNNRDCIELYIMEESLAKSWGIPSISCFNLVSKRLVVFHAVGNLMNMNDEQYDICKKIIYKKETAVNGYEDEKLKVFQKCVHPPWKKFDIWEMPLMELEKKTKMYEAKLKKANKYLKARVKHRLASKNAELLKKLFEKRLNLCRDLRKEIFKIMESPKAYLVKDEL